MKQKKKNIITMVICILFVASICFNFILTKKLDNMVNKKDSMLENNIALKALNEQLEKENKSLKELVDSKNEPAQQCTFTRTFKVVDFLNDEASANQRTFLILDQFQTFYPFIVAVDSEMIKDVQKNVYYEFTFTGKSSLYYGNSSLSEFKIEEIHYTDKVGLSQKQESCIK